MNLKRILFSAVVYVICAIGSAMALIGIVFSCWFFFVSDSDMRFYYGGGFILLFIIGYLIYHFSFPYTTNGWSDYL
jgi:hypothetical protein